MKNPHTITISLFMTVNLQNYHEINTFLIKNGIDSILYGSLGVSVYLGNFRDFDDIDLLIDDIYLEEKWPYLKELMSKINFQIADEHEHQFANSQGVKVAFAGKSVLVDDDICDPIKDIVTLKKGGYHVTTLKPAGFIKAYTFSSTDGYRVEKRGDSDLNIVRKLKLIRPSKLPEKSKT